MRFKTERPSRGITGGPLGRRSGTLPRRSRAGPYRRLFYASDAAG